MVVVRGAAPSFHEHIVYDVFRFCFAADDSAREAEHERGVPIIEGRQGSRVPIRDCANERFVRLWPAFCGGFFERHQRRMVPVPGSVSQRQTVAPAAPVEAAAARACCATD